MSCPYCKNKIKNAYLVASDDKYDGVDAKIIRNNDGIALLAVSGWYDGWSGGAVGIKPELTPINFCPACGRNLVEQ